MPAPAMTYPVSSGLTSTTERLAALTHAHGVLNSKSCAPAAPIYRIYACASSPLHAYEDDDDGDSDESVSDRDFSEPESEDGESPEAFDKDLSLPSPTPVHTSSPSPSPATPSPRTAAPTPPTSKPATPTPAPAPKSAAASSVLRHLAKFKKYRPPTTPNSSPTTSPRSSPPSSSIPLPSYDDALPHTTSGTAAPAGSAAATCRSRPVPGSRPELRLNTLIRLSPPASPTTEEARSQPRPRPSEKRNENARPRHRYHGHSQGDYERIELSPSSLCARASLPCSSSSAPSSTTESAMGAIKPPVSDECTSPKLSPPFSPFEDVTHTPSGEIRFNLPSRLPCIIVTPALDEPAAAPLAPPPAETSQQHLDALPFDIQLYRRALLNPHWSVAMAKQCEEDAWQRRRFEMVFGLAGKNGWCVPSFEESEREVEMIRRREEVRRECERERREVERRLRCEKGMWV